MEYSTRIAQSGLIPNHLRNKPNDILVLIMKGRELGIPPMQAMDGINVIQGKPTVSPQLMLALIYKHCPNAKVVVDANDKDQTVSCSMENNGNKHRVTWDKNKAKDMGLLNKDNWKKQFMNMLKWRAVAECARVVFPHIIMGMYTTEELDNNDSFDYDNEGNAKPRIVEGKVEDVKLGDVNRVHNLVKKLWPSITKAEGMGLYNEIGFNPRKKHTESEIDSFCNEIKDRLEIKTNIDVSCDEIPF
jgi:hypothetical protein